MSNISLRRRHILLVCILHFVAPLPVEAADEPEIAYQKVHKAIMNFQPSIVIEHLSAKRKQQMTSDKTAGANLAANIVGLKNFGAPAGYRVISRSLGPDNKSIRLVASGEAADGFGGKSQVNGTIDLVREGSDWKLQNVAWGKERLFD